MLSKTLKQIRRKHHNWYTCIYCIYFFVTNYQYISRLQLDHSVCTYRTWMKFKFRMLHNLQFPLQNQYYTVNRLSYANTQWYITYKSVFLPTGVWWVIDLQNVHSYLATFGTNHHLKNININCLFLNCPNVPSNQFWRQL